MKDKRFKNLSFPCPHCNKTIRYEFYHAGWSDQIFFYCDSCPAVAIVDLYKDKMANIGLLEKDSDVADMLKPCSCNGRFTAEATPRCPFCNTHIKYEDVVGYFAKVAKDPEYFKSASLPKAWHGDFYYILEGKKQLNPFK